METQVSSRINDTRQATSKGRSRLFFYPLSNRTLVSCLLRRDKTWGQGPSLNKTKMILAFSGHGPLRTLS